MSKIKSGRLDQYGTEPSEQQQFGTAGTKGVNLPHDNYQKYNCVSSFTYLYIIFYYSFVTFHLLLFFPSYCYYYYYYYYYNFISA